MIINHNLNAMNAHRQMGMNTTKTGKSIEKLSSGLRINRAGDDAAGLSISEKMRGQIRGLQQGSRNSQDGISMIQTAEGTLNETHSILQRMRQLAVQSANGSNEDEDRDKITKEFEQLQEEITRLADDCEFNKKKLLNGDMGGGSIGAATAAQIKGSAAKIKGSAEAFSASAAGLKSSASQFTASSKGLEASAIQLKAEAESLKKQAEGLSEASAAVKLQSAATKAGSAAIKTASFSIKQASAAKKQASYEIKVASANTKTQSGVLKEASAGTGVKFQVGANSGQVISLSIDDMRATALGVNKDAINIGNSTTASKAITEIDKALSKVSDQRAVLGAVQNRLEHTIDATDNSAENLQSAESRIRDVDMADEMMNYTKNNVLTSAAQAMLAQANQAPNNVLQLLQ